MNEFEDKLHEDFPSASLGWMMYIGMAVAKFWDAEWDIYSKIDDLYVYMRDKRGCIIRLGCTWW